MEVYASLSAPVAPMAAACVKEKGCFLLMSATNTPRVHFVTGPVMLTAVLQFVMRWIPDLSVVRTPTVRMMTSTLMLTAPQASTVSILKKGRQLPSPIQFPGSPISVFPMMVARSQTAPNMLIQSPCTLPMLHTLTVIMKITECKVNFTSLIYRLQQILGVWTRG